MKPSRRISFVVLPLRLGLTCFLRISSRILLATLADATNALVRKKSICLWTMAFARFRRKRALACIPLAMRWIAVAFTLRKAAI